MTLCVPDIVRPRTVSEVFKAVVLAVAIQVANFMPFWARAKKGQSNALVNEKVKCAPILPRVEPGVPFPVSRRFHDLLGHVIPSSGAEDVLLLGADQPIGANRIEPLEAGDRFPVSVVYDGHEDETFCISVEDNRTFWCGSGDAILVSNCDDPHNVKDGDSESVRDTTINWFKETVPTRVVDIQKSHFIVIMQRVHERDVSGIILSEKMDYEHLCLPMRYEGKSCVTVLGIQDPRTVEGELLDPVRYPGDALDKLESKMGTYAVAGQMQQRPAPRGGGMIKRGWFEIVPAAPAGGKCVRSWDLAGTEKDVTSPDPDWTVGLKMRKALNGFYYIEDVQRDRLAALGVENLIKNTATQDGRSVSITIPKDPGQAGKDQAQGYVRKLATFIAKVVTPSGDKVTRSAAFAAQAEAGNIKLVAGPWVEAFLAEMASFPTGAHDDQVDAAADAFNELVLGNTFDPDKWKALGQ